MSTYTRAVKFPHMMYKAIPHNQRVCRLYKYCLKEARAVHFPDYGAYLMEMSRLRAQFDKYANIVDMREAKRVTEEAERYVYEEYVIEMKFYPLLFPEAPGGVMHDRYPPPHDWVLDGLTYAEKAQYPDYFAKRELRKREYIERWEKQYGKLTDEEKDWRPRNE